MNNTGIVALVVITFVIYLAATGRLLNVVSIVTGKTLTTASATGGGGGSAKAK